MNKIYIATSLDNREAAEKLRLKLEFYGYTVTSEWSKDATNTKTKQLTESEAIELCKKNIQDMKRADTVLFLNHPTCNGSLIEAGFAVGYKYLRLYCIDDASTPRPLMLSSQSWLSFEEFLSFAHTHSTKKTPNRVLTTDRVNTILEDVARSVDVNADKFKRIAWSFIPQSEVDMIEQLEEPEVKFAVIATWELAKWRITKEEFLKAKVAWVKYEELDQ